MGEGDFLVSHSGPTAAPVQSEQNGSDRDIEKSIYQNSHFVNDTVRNLSWDNMSVIVKDRKTKIPLALVDCTSGHVEAGHILAIMGPSGCARRPCSMPWLTGSLPPRWRYKEISW
jgi:hypothetical protein